MSKPIKQAALAVMLGFAGMAGQAMAQTDVPDHPRVNQVDNRQSTQQQRINQGVANGTMSKGQAAHDEQRDANIAHRQSVDEAKHNGHLTKTEQNHLNKAENRNSADIYNQKH